MRHRLLTAAALTLWGVAMTVLGALLMRAHWVPLPRPDVHDPHWGDRVRAAAGGDDRWTALHALKADCPCSLRVFRHLAERSPEPGFRERLLWVTASGTPPDVPPAGYEVVVVTPDEAVGRFDVRAAPLLIVLSPDGRPQYTGGYTARKQGLDFRDRDILAGVRAGRSPAPLPVFGCPIGEW